MDNTCVLLRPVYSHEGQFKTTFTRKPQGFRILTNAQRVRTGFVLVFTHEPWIRLKELPDSSSRIRSVMSLESNEETLYLLK